MENNSNKTEGIVVDYAEDGTPLSEEEKFSRKGFVIGLFINPHDPQVEKCEKILDEMAFELFYNNGFNLKRITTQTLPINLNEFSVVYEIKTENDYIVIQTRESVYQYVYRSWNVFISVLEDEYTNYLEKKLFKLKELLEFKGLIKT